MKPFIIDCGTYPFEILVCFDRKEKRLIKRVSKYLGAHDIEYLNDGNFRSGRSIRFSSGAVLLWARHKPTCPKTYAILAHEIFHCAGFIMDTVGITFSDDSEEAFAYLIQYITEKIFDKLS